jgi:acetyl esterase
VQSFAKLNLDADLLAVIAPLYEQGLFDWEGLDAVGVREKFAGIKKTVTTPDVAHVEDLCVPGPTGSIPCRFYHPAPGTELPLIVWTHGGGWVLGGLDGEEGTARQMATVGQLAILSVDYRLAPEHCFPAAFDDARACFDWAVAHRRELSVTQVGVGGASAGGNLAAAVSIACAGEGGPSPAHQLLIYPILDCDLDRASMHTFSEGPILHRSHMAWFWDQYVPIVQDRCDWRASPLRAQTPPTLPPATIILAACDPLLDEGIAYATMLEDAGIPVSCIVGEHLTHGFVGMSARVPAAQKILHDAVGMVAAALNGE